MTTTPRRPRTRLFELRGDIPRRVYAGAGVAFIALFLAAWLLLTELQIVSPIFLPPLRAVVAEAGLGDRTQQTHAPVPAEIPGAGRHPDDALQFERGVAVALVALVAHPA